MKKNIWFLFVISFLMITNFSFAEEIESTEVLVEQGETVTLNENTEQEEETSTPKEQVLPSQVKGMHLTVFAAASQFHKTRTNDLLDNTEMNAVVIDIKEIDGDISVKNVADGLSYSTKVPSVLPYLKEVKSKGMYAIARIVVFRDNVMPRKRPELAVKNPDGSIWQDRKKLTWLNPYKQGAVDYILELAEKTADMGFDEIQFDYIRFPSDGNTKNCRYGVEHSSTTASAAIVDFLKQAKKRLSPKGIKISIDVFGLTTTEKTDMGIGQKIVEMTEQVDYVSPMIYPSHYNNGEYGIPNPNKEPYRTVYIALQGAKKRIPVEKLRPWLQDFSMKGVKYGPEEIQAQIQACYDCDVKTWLLWNAACKYTKAGLKSKKNQYSYTKTSDEKIKQLLKYKDPNTAMQTRAANNTNKTANKATAKKSTTSTSNAKKSTSASNKTASKATNNAKKSTQTTTKK
ncbi:MAG: putative glycoside hydrolase [Endomicrobiaceae bacterium]|nr:putative glycoside hydrolase [Endomicrobiaceae bacterium]